MPKLTFKGKRKFEEGYRLQKLGFGKRKRENQISQYRTIKITKEH